ncbi:DUF421 domain-containing protein [soil metagenome]
MYFDSWADLLRPFAVGVPAYLALLVLLRISGKRTLAKLNAFDLVVTVALGSTLATILLSADVSLAKGVAALFLLVILQFAITWTSVRWPMINRFVKAEPALLFHDGEYLEKALRTERITRSEVEAIVRSSGMANMQSVRAVVLETTGLISIIERGGSAPGAPLKGVKHFEQAADGEAAE